MLFAQNKGTDIEYTRMWVRKREKRFKKGVDIEGRG